MTTENDFTVHPYSPGDDIAPDDVYESRLVEKNLAAPPDDPIFIATWLLPALDINICAGPGDTDLPARLHGELLAALRELISELQACPAEDYFEPEYITYSRIEVISVRREHTPET